MDAVITNAKRALHDLENPLDRIASLATTASILVEHCLGRAQPAQELEVLLSFINETVEKAQEVREAGIR
jgi:hypothetical protein